MNTTIIHVGELLKNYIDTNKIYKSALARKLQRKDSAIIRYQHSASIQINILIDISHALKHNFFSDIAAQLPSAYSTNAPIDNSKEARIAQLEKEIDLLKAKNEALMEALKG